MVGALLAGMVALLLVAGSMLLWQAARTRDRRQATSDFVESKLTRHAPAGAAPPIERRRAGRRLGPAGWRALLMRAGVAPTAAFYLGLILPLVLLPLLALLFGGPLAAAVLVPLVAVFSYFRLWLKAARRQRRMVLQLPGFLDAMVRLITIGNSLGSAFQSASLEVESPLLEVLERAASMNRSGVELDVALRQVAELYRLQELYLVSSVMGLALRYGGRSDQVLERMAAFMRDLHQARQELIALSGEVRMSAWILALLPVGVAGFIVVFNNDLFMGMWNDDAGRKMLAFAVLLQLAGSWWLYRMAKSV